MISFVAVSISDEATKNVGPKPPGTAENDLMVALVWAYEEEVTSAPSGWVLRESNSTNDVTGEPEKFNSYLYQKEAGASEPADYTWVTTTDTGPTPNRRVVIVSYRGTFISPPDNGIVEDRAPHTENAGSNQLTLANMDTGEPGYRLVLLAAVGIPGITGTLGSPYVERLDDDGNFVYDRRITVTGSISSDPLILSTVVTSWGYQVMLIANPDAAGDRNYCASIDTQIN